jgi:hypothetical protein
MPVRVSLQPGMGTKENVAKNPLLAYEESVRIITLKLPVSSVKFDGRYESQYLVEFVELDII